jgi:hypothetical protein
MTNPDHDAALPKSLEQRLVDRLSKIDYERLQPGLEERAWLQFCELTGIEPAPPAPHAAEVEPKPLPPRPAVAHGTAQSQVDTARRLGFSRASHPALRSPRPATGF